MIDISYSQIRILDTARSLRSLVKIYSDGRTSDIYATQMNEIAKMLEEMAGVKTENSLLFNEAGKKIKKIFQSNGIKLDSIFFYHKDNSRADISIVAHLARHGCVMTSELAELVSEIMGKCYIPVKGCRSVITEMETEIVLEEAPIFYVLNGHAGVSQRKNVISGDSFTFMHGGNGKAVAGIADGMGTGREAERTSRKVVELVEQFTEAGFSEKTTAGLINAAFSCQKEDNPVTIDIAGFDLYKGNCRFIKLGAAASFIWNRNGVDIVKPSSLPAGVIEEVEEDVTDVELKGGEYIVMVSDGVIDALPFYDKEQHFAKIVDETADIHTNPQKLAEAILEEVLFYETGKRRDDMTILVTGVWKNQLAFLQ